jgi:hypothetical protein
VDALRRLLLFVSIFHHAFSVLDPDPGLKMGQWTQNPNLGYRINWPTEKKKIRKIFYVFKSRMFFQEVLCENPRRNKLQNFVLKKRIRIDPH